MIVPLSGPSFSGKTTLLKGLRQAIYGLQPLLSITTREPRPTDEPGEYKHISDTQFDELLSANMFAWWDQPEFTTHRYGTLKNDVDPALLDERIHMPILTLKGLRDLLVYARRARALGRVRPIYLMSTQADLLRKRAKERGETDELVIERRIKTGLKENMTLRRLGIPLCVINAEEPKEQVLAKTLNYIAGNVFI